MSGIYNLTYIWASEGDTEKTMGSLEEAIKQGFPKSYALDDKDFEFLREDKRLIELVKPEFISCL